MKAGKIRDEWVTDSEQWKGLCKTCYSPHMKTAVKGEKGEKYLIQMTRGI